MSGSATKRTRGAPGSGAPFETPSHNVESPFILAGEYKQKIDAIEAENFTLKMALERLKGTLNSFLKSKSIAQDVISKVIDQEVKISRTDVTTSPKDSKVIIDEFTRLRSENAKLKSEVDSLKKVTFKLNTLSLAPSQAFEIQLQPEMSNFEVLEGETNEEGELRNQIHSLKEENARLAQELSSIKEDGGDIITLYNQLEDRQNTIKVLQERIDKLEGGASISQVNEEDLEDIEKHIEKLQSENQELKNDLTSQISANEKLTGEVESLQAELATSRKDSSESENIEKLKSENSELKQKVDELTNENQRLKEKLKRMDKVAAENSEIRRFIRDLSSQMENLKARQTNFEKLSSENDAKKERIGKMSSQIEQKEGEIATLKEENSKLEENVKGQLKEMQSLKDKLKEAGDVVSENSALRQKVENLGSELKKKSEENAKLNVDVLTSRKSEDDMRIEDERIKFENDSLKSRIAILEGQNDSPPLALSEPAAPDMMKTPQVRLMVSKTTPGLSVPETPNEKALIIKKMSEFSGNLIQKFANGMLLSLAKLNSEIEKIFVLFSKLVGEQKISLNTVRAKYSGLCESVLTSLKDAKEGCRACLLSLAERMEEEETPTQSSLSSTSSISAVLSRLGSQYFPQKPRPTNGSFSLLSTRKFITPRGKESETPESTFLRRPATSARATGLSPITAGSYAESRILSIFCSNCCLLIDCIWEDFGEKGPSPSKSIGCSSLSDARAAEKTVNSVISIEKSGVASLRKSKNTEELSPSVKELVSVFRSEVSESSTRLSKEHAELMRAIQIR